MDSNLVLGNFEPDDRRGLFARQSRAQRSVQERAELDVLKLVAGAKKQEYTALLRKHMTEYGMEDIADVGRLAQELADGDQFIAAALIPIVQEFARQTARDVRDFGRGLEYER